jgi:tRNA threonylcarbamoyladenosine biosynthesis protein TsaE
MQQLSITTKSADQTKEFGSLIASCFSAGDILILGGTLGAGKTTLVKGIAQGLGISELILSPTFVLLSCYKGSSLNLLHVDAYRLENLNEVLDLGIEEFLSDSLVVIEWGKYVKQVLPQISVQIEINMKDSDFDTRELSLTVFKDSNCFLETVENAFKLFDK